MATWECAQCSFDNGNSDPQCTLCGYPKPAAAPLPVPERPRRALPAAPAGGGGFAPACILCANAEIPMGSTECPVCMNPIAAAAAPAAPPGGGAARGGPQWKCAVCTNVNESDMNECSMCTSLRPEGGDESKEGAETSEIRIKCGRDQVIGDLSQLQLPVSMRDLSLSSTAVTGT